MSRVFNSAAQKWEWAQSYEHNGEAWVEVMRGDQDEAAVLTSMFDHDAGTYIGQGTVLQRGVAGMPVHPLSDEMAQFMWDTTPFRGAGAIGSRTSLNASTYGTGPVHAYVVDSSNPATGWREFGSQSRVAGGTDETTELYMRGKIAMPDWALPADMHAVGSGDHGIAVYDLATGIMREWFYSVPQEDGTWGGLGGFSVNTPGLKNLASDNYGLQQRYGLSNVAGMHNSLGFIGIAEALKKKVEHALCFTLAAAHSQARYTQGGLAYGGTSWPARGSDGKAENYAPGGSKYASGNAYHFHNGVPPTPGHGQWARLKADVDPMHNPRTGRPYAPFTRVLIEAAKVYGLLATDTNLWCQAFNAEQGLTWKHVYGEDPWSSNGIISQVYSDPDDPSGIQGLSVADFPWDRTEWSLIDWGRPSPDWNLRPGQPVPWWSPSDPNNPLNTMPS